MKSLRLPLWTYVALALSCLVSMVSPAKVTAEPLRVFAAASLKTALDQIATEFSKDTGTQVSISYAGSSALARQIGLGAPADVFISANVGWMDELEKQERVVKGTRIDLLRNRLVVIAASQSVPLGNLGELSHALDDGRLATAQTNAVPAGIYGKAALQHAGVWDDLSERVAQTDNVRAALALVATGAAPFGIVYQTDANAETRVSVAFNIPETAHPPIIYPAAAMRDTETSRAFLQHLQSNAARQVFLSQGFTPIGAP
ncbi:molybdate ABC transporter substrate-binding protein [Tritonibacter mobilis]|uniref:Molybdate-binding protein ModA n=1 Tax=Tritonibacter mobilis F1926 TaxID=1265309 RepID=A0A1B1A6Q3_9RHOB|nr:molybdate ABC transporter substrate-binding protein [Tritonibacter mobilis]ANP42274.1 molybdate ABC transporter substrate-binding protein [Tritonibacter mobilis F1926]KJZ22631.1 molybdenum ABC transporter substrate-binding protein [Tritonibacter mobilis]